MPVVGPMGPSPAAPGVSYAAPFTHADEQASPGSYGVQLDSGIGVSLTVTARSGFGLFTFPATASTGTLLVDASGSGAGDNTSEAHIMGTDEITGSATSPAFCSPYKVYFAARFSQPFAAHGVWSGATVSPDDADAAGPHAGAYLSFDTTTTPTVLVKVGLSFVDAAGARANLRAEDPQPLTPAGFDTMRAQARAAWDSRLSRVDAQGGSDADTRTFYTALYHTLLHPNVFSDADGRYTGFDGQVHQAFYTDTTTGATRPYTQYANYSGWDIYRSEIPLLALLAPHEASDMMQSLVADAQQGSALPLWAFANAETGVMVGDPADAIIAGAHAFGATDFDTRAALQAMLKGANQTRPGLDDYLKLGYVPLRDWSSAGAMTLEYAVADFSIAQLAQELGDTSTHATFMQRAQKWQNLFNPATGYTRARLPDGTYLPNFDPTSGYGFIEGTTSQYTWMAPQNLHALFTAMGGNQQATNRLDTFFTQLNTGGSGAPYAWLGNEQDLEVPWEYDWAGAPWRTQAVVRQALTQLYSDAPAGLPGNDDLGAMSSWYVWGALGLYPEVPGAGTLALASPLFPRVTLHLATGDVTIDAPGASDAMPYVQGLTVNGQPTTKPWLPVSALTAGPATLAFALSDQPNTSWGSTPADAPPSDATGEAPGIGFATPGDSASDAVVVPAGGGASFQLGVRNVTDAPSPLSGILTLPHYQLAYPSPPPTGRSRPLARARARQHWR